MSTPHRRQQDGGRPEQGPPPDVANPQPKPSDGNDFPDAPDDADTPSPDTRPID